MAWRSYNALVNGSALLILDARNERAYLAGHLKGSVCVQVSNGSLQHVSGPGWSKHCWWGRDVFVVPEMSKKRKHGEEVATDSVVKFLQEESLVKSLKILESDDEEPDAFSSLAKRYPFLVTKSLRATKIPSYPAEIVSGLLYLGDMDHAMSPSILKDLGITSVLTVHTERLKPYKGFCHEFFDLADEVNAGIALYFDQAFEFIEEARRSNRKVLVHCGAGASRSATICAYYLMRINVWNVEKTLNFLKGQRKQVDPNPGFLLALQAYDKLRSHLQSASLDVYKNNERLCSINLETSSTLFGRLPTCDVVLDHASISRKHARLFRSGNSWVLEDLDSSHGTYVNNVRVSKRQLESGDIITFGASSRRYVLSY